MNACVNTYEMRMPAHYVDMDRNEMEYDGGFWWVIPCAVVSGLCTVIGFATTALNKAGYINDNDARTISGVCAVVGTVTGVASGLGSLYTAGANTGKCLVGFMNSTVDPALSNAHTIATW